MCRFGVFELDAGSRQLFKAGREVHLQEQPLRLLILLLDRPGELHTRDELRKSLWPNDTFVEFDDGLNTAIQKIRQVLGDEARCPRFVETVPRQGYRFIAPVQFALPAGHGPAPLESLDPRRPPLAASSGLPPIVIRIDWRIATFLATLAGICVGWIATQQPGSNVVYPLRLSLTPPPGVNLRPGIRGGSAISPDGLSIVFAGSREGKNQLWLRRLDSTEARPLPGTEDGGLPFWSPDSKWIGFQSAGKIRRLEISGGSPIDVAVATRPTRGGWTEDGAILFATGSGGPIQRVPVAGGPPVPVTLVSAGGSWPYPVGGTGRFLYFDNGIRKVQLAAMSGTSPPAEVFSSDASAIYAPPYDARPARLLFLKGTTLMAQAFNPASGSLYGDPVAVAEGVGFAERWRFVDVSVSSNGVLLYGPGNTVQSRLTWIRRDGSVAGYVGEQDWLRSVRLSPDGRRVLIERGIPRGLWIFDFERSLLTRASFDQEWSGWPVWSPSGLEIAYSGERAGHVGLYRRNAKVGRSSESLGSSSFDDFLYDWSQDNRYLIYCEVNPTSKLDLWVLPLTGNQTPRPFLRTPANEDWPQFSPDGNWVAYVSDESGRNEVYVTSFPGAEGKWQISTDGGSMPRWAGGELFFESAAGQMIAVQTRSSLGRFEWTSQRGLFLNPIPGSVYDVSPQGDRFLMMTPADGKNTNELTVIVNWHAALPREGSFLSASWRNARTAIFASPSR